MQNRTSIFITIAAVLVVGSLFAAGIYWGIYSTSTFNATYDDVRVPSGDENVDASVAPRGSDSSNPNPTSTASNNSRQVDQPYVMKLLKASNKKQSFGSYRVIGIICNDAAPESSNATIEDLNNNTSSVYSINDTMPDSSQLADIKQNYVILQKDGVRKRIFIQSRRSSSGLTAASDGFNKINDSEYNLNPYQVFKGDADKILDFSMKLSGQDGIKISDINNNSLARNLGLQEGDVLLAVNNESVDSLLKGINASINAYNSDDLVLKIRRGDQVIDVTYHLFWEGQGSWTPGDVLNSKAVSSLLKNGFFTNLF